MKGDLARSTMGLSAAMLSGMFLIYLMFNWAPMLLSAQGFSLRETSLGLTWFNMGGTAGAMLAALAIMWVGSRLTLPVMAGLGALVCALLASLPMLLVGHGAGVMVALALLGMTASAAQSAMFALGAHTFPLPLRARGMGLMGTAGRIGALASAFAGSWLVVGWTGFFATLGALMVVNMASFLAVRGHIPPLGRGRTEDLQG